VNAAARARDEPADVVGWLSYHTGLDFSGCHRKRLTATVRAAIVESGAPDHRAFLDLLASDPQRIEQLIDQLTVGETYFMREPAHFELLRTSIAEERSATRPGALRIWSAGCATGEEPYSVAVTLDEAGMLPGATIIGTDLSTSALVRARRATYGKWSLRRCGDDERARWFDVVGSRFQLRDRYRGAVEFRASGLLEGPPGASFDVVMCRNVLIYLTADAIGAAADALHDALAPGGWLLTGASDPTIVHPGLQRTIHGQGVAYRRVVPAPGAMTDAALAGARRPRPSEHRAPVRSSAVAPRPTTAPRVLVGRSPGQRAQRESGSRAPIPDSEKAASPERLDPLARCHRAAVHLDAGRPREAASEAGAALYLDPTLIGAHLLLASAAENVDDPRTARRSYENALALLVDHPADVRVDLLDEPPERVMHAVLEALNRVEPFS